MPWHTHWGQDGFVESVLSFHWVQAIKFKFSGLCGKSFLSTKSSCWPLNLTFLNTNFASGDCWVWWMSRWFISLSWRWCCYSLSSARMASVHNHASLRTFLQQKNTAVITRVQLWCALTSGWQHNATAQLSKNTYGGTKASTPQTQLSGPVWMEMKWELSRGMRRSRQQIKASMRGSPHNTHLGPAETRYYHLCLELITVWLSITSKGHLKLHKLWQPIKGKLRVTHRS